MVRPLFIASLLFLIGCSTVPPSGTPGTVKVPGFHPPPVIDGQLSDPAWRSAPAVHLSPWNHPSPIRAQTTARFHHDRTALYIAFQTIDEQISCRHKHRDQAIYEDDCMEVMISPNGELHTYYEIVISASNVVYDARITSPDLRRDTMQVDLSWNANGLEHAVDQTPGNGTITWQVELAIPWSTWGLEAPPPHGCRLNLHRVNPGASAQFFSWRGASAGKPDFHQPEKFGTLLWAKP